MNMTIKTAIMIDVAITATEMKKTGIDVATTMTTTGTTTVTTTNSIATANEAVTGSGNGNASDLVHGRLKTEGDLMIPEGAIHPCEVQSL